MGWELINEPRCQFDHSGKTLIGWVQEMACYVKSNDRKLSLEIGMEGIYGDSIPNRKRFNPGYQVGPDLLAIVNKRDRFGNHTCTPRLMDRMIMLECNSSRDG